MSAYSERPPSPSRVGEAVRISLIIFLVIFVLVGSIFGLWAGIKAFHRHQQLADANNQVRITAIQIRNQEQRVKIARQQAQIRFENSKGVREAQDEIAKTLTPLYVQFEMVEALKEIARSGRNNSVVYLPSGANGIPLVSNVPGANQVGQPSK